MKRSGKKNLAEDHDDHIPFYVEPITLNLVREHRELIAAIKLKLGATNPAAVAMDTLNRSLEGSESDDADMTAYGRAADAIREAFRRVVTIVHHCGIDGTRSRGHTSLTGACDAQLSVKRDHADNIIVEMECAKDGPQGKHIASRLEKVDVGIDEDSEAITSCVVVPVEIKQSIETSSPRLSRNQQTMFTILHNAGERGLTPERWYECARASRIGTKRKADPYDIRSGLEAKHLIRQTESGWVVNHISQILGPN